MPLHHQPINPQQHEQLKPQSPKQEKKDEVMKNQGKNPISFSPKQEVTLNTEYFKNSRNNIKENNEREREKLINQTIDYGNKVTDLNESFSSSILESKDLKSETLKKLQERIKEKNKQKAGSLVNNASLAGNASSNNAVTSQINNNSNVTQTQASKVKLPDVETLIQKKEPVRIQSTTEIESEINPNQSIDFKNTLFQSVQSNIFPVNTKDETQNKEKKIEEEDKSTHSEGMLSKRETVSAVNTNVEIIIPQELQEELEKLKEANTKLELELDIEKKKNMILNEEIQKMRSQIKDQKLSTSSVSEDAFAIERSKYVSKIKSLEADKTILVNNVKELNTSVMFFKDKVDELHNELSKLEHICNGTVTVKERSLDNIMNLSNKIANNLYSFDVSSYGGNVGNNLNILTSHTVQNAQTSYGKVS